MSGIVYDINNAFRGLAETLTLIECDYEPPPTHNNNALTTEQGLYIY